MRNLVVFFILFSGFTVHAGPFDYQRQLLTHMTRYFQDVNAQAQRAPVPEGRCSAMYRNIVEKGSMDVRYALGYFDLSTGEDVIDRGHNYGLSPSLDIEAFNAIRTFLKRSCLRDSSQELCGFNESGDPVSGRVILTKSLTNFSGRPVEVSISLTQASASEFYSANIPRGASEFYSANDTLSAGGHWARQRQMTARSEANYFGGIGRADVVFYNGHSRNGGGPDFNPPRLNSHRKTDYDGYYEVVRPGFSRILQQLNQAQNPDQILGFFSCYSRQHFHQELVAANPQQRLIVTTREEIDYFDTMLASMGYLEGILQGRCGQDLADLAKQGQKIPQAFQGYNLR